MDELIERFRASDITFNDWKIPSDLFLFGYVKWKLRVCVFNSIDEIIEIIKENLNLIDQKINRSIWWMDISLNFGFLIWWWILP